LIALAIGYSAASMTQEGPDFAADPMPPEIAALSDGAEPVWIFEVDPDRETAGAVF
jgi:hypothetical protein